jgi:CubicO group peptidase (beta-lactamase class C family)
VLVSYFVISTHCGKLKTCNNLPQKLRFAKLAGTMGLNSTLTKVTISSTFLIHTFVLTKLYFMRLLSAFTFIASFILISCNYQTSTLLNENSDLRLGLAVKDSLKKSEADTFRLNLSANAFVRGFANQLNMDVEVHILDPSKKETNSYDESARGYDYFFFNTKEAGEYIIAVKPFRENEGAYELTISQAEPIATDPAKRVDQIIAAMIPPDGPGATVAVMKDNQLVYSKGFGHANLEYDIHNTPQTIFHIASVSKQFTAFAIALLADEGKLSIHDDIRKYLPELHDFGTPITINHLVHHSSGLRDQWNLLAMAGWRLDDVITRNQILRLISKQRELNTRPGEEFNYCNTGYTLMAEIVSRVTGKPFPEWMKERVFNPLDMKGTLFYDDHEKLVPNRAYSYYLRDTIYKKSVLSYANAGATSLFTTPEDLMKWAMNFETMKVGNPNVMAMMEEKFILNKGDTINYAFGQDISTYKGLKTASHGGGDAGYRTFLVRFPEQHFAVAVFSNLASFSPGGLSYAIADAYLSDQYREEPRKEEPRRPEEKKEPFDATQVRLDDYVGRYYSAELETFYELEVVNDTLVAHHQRHDDFKIWPQTADAFRSNAWWMGDLRFTRNGARKVDGLKASSGRVKNVDFRKQ